MAVIHRVLATREGLVGKRTSSGWVIDPTVPFVALPNTKALSRAVRVWVGQSTIDALVLDVGPWNIHDPYVFADDDKARPLAESNIDLSGTPKTNGAGIDLGEKVWKALGLNDNGFVFWRFLE